MRNGIKSSFHTRVAPGSRVLLLLALAGIVCGVLWLYRSGLLWQLPDLIRSCGPFGVLISYLLIVLQSFIPFAPFALLAGGNALVHGFWLGYLSTWAGALTGALLLYSLSRRTMNGPLSRRLHHFLTKHPRIEYYRKQMEMQRGWSVFSVILLLRLQPWLPSSAIDLSAGASRMRFAPFAVATLVGQAPMIALESYVGTRLLAPVQHMRELFILGILSFVFLVGYLLRRKRQQATHKW